MACRRERLEFASPPVSSGLSHSMSSRAGNRDPLLSLLTARKLGEDQLQRNQIVAVIRLGRDGQDKADPASADVITIVERRERRFAR
jgi:hypothetical protein